jgi:hypothetical protein
MTKRPFRVTIKQERVADILHRHGWREPTNKIYDVFTALHGRIDGLDRRKNNPSKAKAVWYDYYSDRGLTVKDAEKEVADRLVSLLRLPA